jgi:hypothetical protein
VGGSIEKKKPADMRIAETGTPTHKPDKAKRENG